MQKVSKLIGLLGMVVLSSLAFALPEDRNQPIHVSADQASLNEATGVSVYSGNVEIKQGSMILKGSRVELHRDNQGSIARIVSSGNPAEFQQQSVASQPVTRAYGNQMDYRIPTQLITITGNAQVQQANDRFTGQRIVYNMDKSIVDAFGSEQPGGQRVEMIIQPRSNN
ncbi:Lipopolysaccharide export system protein lptA precursor [Nitrincola nitratireducens]|uniref:Lipopolysaccharide export system protein LptA n=1 Tax=Nitrincola nitratireducens TaxID=1229521 RepID=W9VQJ6_9GAMM|nr:Lipopolysaccharide export system protein lptA precursor [Nitrincola nitratireducens]